MSTRTVTSVAYFGIHGYAEKYDCDENSNCQKWNAKYKYNESKYDRLAH